MGTLQCPGPAEGSSTWLALKDALRTWVPQAAPAFNLWFPPLDRCRLGWGSSQVTRGLPPSKMATRPRGTHTPAPPTWESRAPVHVPHAPQSPAEPSPQLAPAPCSVRHLGMVPPGSAARQASRGERTGPPGVSRWTWGVEACPRRGLAS